MLKDSFTTASRLGFKIMPRAERPAIREFTSLPADIARHALGVFHNDWPSEPKEMHFLAVKLWRETIGKWFIGSPYEFPMKKWVLMNQCPSSLLWTPKLISMGGRKPRARFCRETWLCPFCYCREIVKFLGPFENRRFSVRTYQQDFYDPNVAWQYTSEIGESLLEQHNGYAVWRQVYPFYNRTDNLCRVGWALRATWLYPGDNSLARNADQLIQALGYPMGTLTSDVSIHEVTDGMRFMRHHQGRMRRGCYRDTDRNDPD